jgi:hypothetical protein
VSENKIMFTIGVSCWCIQLSGIVGKSQGCGSEV